MIELFTILSFCLVIVSVYQQVAIRSYAKRLNTSMSNKVDAEYRSIEMAERLANVSTLNAAEIMESMLEQNTTLTVESDIWNAPLPYGKWGKFEDGSGRPSPEIRGFWLGCPGKLIGVKMPEGSEYDLHSHPWVEILVGMSGVVWVEIEDSAGQISRHRLGPEDVLKIAPGVRHAVARAESAAQLTCIWGLPKQEND